MTRAFQNGARSGYDALPTHLRTLHVIAAMGHNTIDLSSRYLQLLAGY